MKGRAHQQSNQINISSVPLLFAIEVDNNVAFFTSIFTSIRLCVVWRRLRWPADPKTNHGSLLPDGAPYGGEIQVLLANTATPRTRGLFGHQARTIQRSTGILLLLLGLGPSGLRPRNVRATAESLPSGTTPKCLVGRSMPTTR
jgi:hypothetical protein